jgi:hypothetical protein
MEIKEKKILWLRSRLGVELVTVSIIIILANECDKRGRMTSRLQMLCKDRVLFGSVIHFSGNIQSNG